MVKAFVSVDMEGISGLVHSDHMSRDGKDYELARRLMTLEANAAIEGAFEGGADEVVVNDSHGTSMNLRIGIHSGAVVAGVIGETKFIYDLWGDTVNVASRMESHGVPGEIQVSSETYALLRDHFRFECRGEIELKNRGKVTTWLLVGRG